MGTWGIGPFDNDTAADEQGERFTNSGSLYPVLTLFDAATWTNLAGWPGGDGGASRPRC